MPRQKVRNLISAVGQGTVNSTDPIRQRTANVMDKEFAILKRLVEKRDRDAAHATAASIGTRILYGE